MQGRARGVWILSMLAACWLSEACSSGDDRNAQRLLPVETAGSMYAAFGGAGATPVPVPSQAGGSADTLGVGLAGSSAPPMAAGAAAPSMLFAGAPAPSSMLPAAESGGVPVNPAECPAAPPDAPAQASMALAVVNNYRVPAGAGCATMVSQINASAAAHCAYYDMYMMNDMCIANPHLEVMGCAGFSGATPGDRMKTAGYTMFGGGEVMAFVNSPQGAVDTWMNSIWHRVPIIDPWTTHLGYGNSTNCDTIDFGRGTTPAPANTVVVYPYDGQTNVPTAFNGQYEGPMPPTPPSGWPSSGPISVSAQKIVVSEHVLMKDGDPTPIEHVWLDSVAEIVAADMRRQLTNVVFMYANLPFAANTKYRVKIAGSYTGGALSKEWTFTTGAAAPTWGRK
jgi:hypothetical protein